MGATMARRRQADELKRKKLAAKAVEQNVEPESEKKKKKKGDK